MDYFFRLGAWLQDAWRDADRDEERFPDVAMAALEQLPPRDHFDRTAFLDAVLDPRRPGLQQLSGLHTFGQPGMTMYHGEGFVIDVYYWIDSASAIHNHPFCGVFTILEGYSVHACYSTSVMVRAGAAGHLCDIRLVDLELLDTFATKRFSLRRHPLIHALVHVPVPSISMVVRTVRTEGYLRFLPPSLALPMAAPPEPAGRRLAMLESLVHADDPQHAERIDAALADADFETAMHLLGSLWPGSEEAQRERYLAMVEPQHGDRVDAMRAALDRGLRLQEASAIRTRLRHDDHRLCATALAYAENRRQVLDVLAGRPGDPVGRLHRFVDSAGLFAPDEDASRIIAHALCDGGGAEQAMADLREAYDAASVQTNAAKVHSYCRQSLFAPLALT